MVASAGHAAGPAGRRRGRHRRLAWTPPGSCARRRSTAEWDGLPLRDELGRQLGCEVTVAQDDHLSPIAESSDAGTFPGASSLLVIEIGRGIGVGMTLDGAPIAGAHRRFGRIAGWPVTDPAGAPGTLGECLVTGGLVRPVPRARRIARGA